MISLMTERRLSEITLQWECPLSRNEESWYASMTVLRGRSSSDDDNEEASLEILSARAKNDTRQDSVQARQRLTKAGQC